MIEQQIALEAVQAQEDFVTREEFEGLRKKVEELEKEMEGLRGRIAVLEEAEKFRLEVQLELVRMFRSAVTEGEQE